MLVSVFASVTRAAPTVPVNAFTVRLRSATFELRSVSGNVLVPVSFPASSEVIHAGIYYPTGSLKARLCVAGRRALYGYLEQHDVPHRRLGKLIVATSEDEVPTLAKYKAQAEANGVDDLAWVEAREAREVEPEVRCVRALLSPSTGILDSHGLMRAYERDALRLGAAVALESPVVGGRIGDGGILVSVGGRSPIISSHTPRPKPPPLSSAIVMGHRRIGRAAGVCWARPTVAPATRSRCRTRPRRQGA